MADLFKTIASKDYSSKGVRLLPSRVVGEASTIQRVFDELSLDVIIPALNSVISTLNGLMLDLRVTSNDIKAIRVNSSGVIEISLNGTTWVAVSDPKGSIADLKENLTNYINTYANDIRDTLESKKANKTNVLEKNNTVAYVPTSSYHPATKQYVDDKLSTKGDMPRSVYDPNKRNTDIFAYVDNAVFNSGSADMTKSIYDPTGRNTDIFGYIDKKIGDVGSTLDAINGEVF